MKLLKEEAIIAKENNTAWMLRKNALIYTKHFCGTKSADGLFITQQIDDVLTMHAWKTENRKPQGWRRDGFEGTNMRLYLLMLMNNVHERTEDNLEGYSLYQELREKEPPKKYYWKKGGRGIYKVEKEGNPNAQARSGFVVDFKPGGVYMAWRHTMNDKLVDLNRKVEYMANDKMCTDIRPFFR